MPSRLSQIRPFEFWERLRAIRSDVRSARIHSEGAFRTATENGSLAAEIIRAVQVCQQQLRDVRADVVQASTTASNIEHELRAQHERLLERLLALEERSNELRNDLERARATASSDQERTLLALRVVRDHDAAARAMLWSMRASEDYDAVFEEDEPLVTILVGTYMNWPLLRDRSLPSLLGQTYEHWEAIIVGDDAPDEARQVVESFGDDRLRFVNLPYRGPYPDDPRHAWQISGTEPWNAGLALARGRWIASNSDDDALRPRHIESLLAHARRHRAEVSYGYIDMRLPDGSGEQLGAFPPASGQWNMEASLLHGGLRFLTLQPSDWVFDVPNDVSLLERMLRIGVRFSMLREPVVDIYPSRAWSEREPGRLARREPF